MDKKIEYILAVADCRSISKASEVLYVSQPSLSRFISKLEEELGLKLFKRSANGICLTEAGEVYVDYAQRIKNLQGEMDRKLEQMRQNVNKNEITICMTLNVSSMSTHQITEQFHKKYPQCQLTFMNTLSKDIQFFLDEQRCSFAIGPDVVDHKRYKLRLLNSEHLILAVPTIYDVEYLAEERDDLPFKWIDMAKLPEMDFLLQDASCNVRRGIDELLQEASVPIQPKMEFTNSILVIQAAERQMGCCFISEAFFPYILNRELLRFYCVKINDSFSNSFAIYAKEQNLSKQEEHCIALIKRALREKTEMNRSEFLDVSYKD